MNKIIRFLLVVCLLFFIGLLTGVQFINEQLGITEHEPLEIESIEIERHEEIKQKQKRVEETGSFNFFSDLGLAVADYAYNLSRYVLTQIMSFVHHVINGEPR